MYFKKTAIIVTLFIVSGLGFVLTATAQQHHKRDDAHAWPDHIILTWEQDPASSFSVTWRTDVSVSKARAQIALAYPAPKFTRNAKTVKAKTEVLDVSIAEKEEGKIRYHSVTFVGLEPDTLYAYRVGNGEYWSEWFQVRTASKKPEPFSFIYFGDAQNGIFSHWSRVIRAAAMKANDARFMIHAGDLVNNAHRGYQWDEWFKAGRWIHGMIPSIPAPGNHGYDEYKEGEEGDYLSIYWKPQFTLPENGVKGLEETSYYIDYQGVRIITLNSNVKIEEQAIWLESVLSDNPNRWTVATFHHPIFSSSEGRDNKKLRETWKPIFDKYQVDLVMQGHDHTYARGRASNLASSLSTTDHQAGTVYVNSVSGAKMYELKENLWRGYDDIQMKRHGENTQLFQVIHVKNDTLQYRAYTVTGRLYDSFDLVKKKNAPNEFIERISADSFIRTHENTISYRDKQ